MEAAGVIAATGCSAVARAPLQAAPACRPVRLVALGYTQNGPR
jgi:hypothetical protein